MARLSDTYDQCPSCAEFAVLVAGDMKMCTCCGVVEPNQWYCPKCEKGVMIATIPNVDYGMFVCSNDDCAHEVFKNKELPTNTIPDRKCPECGQNTVAYDRTHWRCFQCNFQVTKPVDNVPAEVPEGSTPCERCKVGYIVAGLSENYFHCNNIKCEYFIRFPTQKEETVALTPEVKKCQVMIFADEVVAYDADAEVTCNRQGGSPHRHFTIIQNELDMWGNIVMCAVNPGLHTKEVREIIAELGDKGVHVYMDDKTEERITEKAGIEVKLAAEGHPLKYWVDVRRIGGSVVGHSKSWPVGEIGEYAEARKYGLQLATALNCTFNDTVEKKANG